MAYSTSTAPRPMAARFAGSCRKCRGPIAVGDAILYGRETGAVHAQCPAAVQVALPAVEAPRLAVEDAGIYVLPDGTVCKVKANKEKSRTYALRWTDITGERLVEDGDHRHGEYVYEAGLVALVAAQGRKMTLAEAKHWSIRYGQCIRCGRTLKAAESVEKGIGPVCIKWFSGV